MADHPGVTVQFHNWWNAPQTWAKVQEIDLVASHASRMENFPWTRLAGVTLPAEQKSVSDLPKLRFLAPEGVRALLGDVEARQLRGDRDAEAAFREVVHDADPGALDGSGRV